jgi:hypothetical protein
MYNERAFATSSDALGLKRYAIRFEWEGKPKTLRLTDYSEEAAWSEFKKHFPGIRATRIDFLEVVGSAGSSFYF